MLFSQILSHSSDTTGSACRPHDPCRGRKQVDEHHVDVSNEEDEYPYESIQEKKNMSKLLTIQEVQNELSVSRSSIYRLIGRGKFDVVYGLGSSNGSLINGIDVGGWKLDSLPGMASTGDRREHFPKIEAKYGHPVEHWFDQLAMLGSDKYPDQMGFLQNEHGFSKAHANAVVMFYRGSTSSKRHDDPEAYFSTLQPAQEATAREIFAAVRGAYPDLELVIAWNQPMLRRGSDYVFGLSASTNHLSVNPFSPKVLAELRSVLEGYDVLKHTVRIPLDRPIDRNLFVKMVALRLSQLKDFET